jgi:Na+-transporting NADH:ubiquinone oxidoreductase subunit NqrB
MQLVKVKNVFKDPRDFQILFHSSFLMLGIWFLKWDTNILAYGTIVLACLFTQLLGIVTLNLKWDSLKSAIITALGLCIIFKANMLSTYFLVGFLSIAGKFVLKHDGKHIFNPSLFGIVVCLLLTNDAWVSPGQWGNSWVVGAFLAGAALLMLFKVGRVDISVAFLATLMLLEFSRTVIYLGWETEVFFHKFTSGTILLFAFFMITDPVTSPKSSKGRIIWGIIVAVVTFFLGNWFQNYTAPIWAMFFLMPTIVLFNKIFKGQEFFWLPFSKSSSLTPKTIQL